MTVTADAYVDHTPIEFALEDLPLGTQITANDGTVWTRTESSLGATRWRAAGSSLTWRSGMLSQVIDRSIPPTDVIGRPLDIAIPEPAVRPYTRDADGGFVCGDCGKPVHKSESGWTHSLVEDYLGGCWWRNPWQR